MPHNFMSKRKTRPCLRPAKRMDRHLNLKGLKKNNGFGFGFFFSKKKEKPLMFFWRILVVTMFVTWEEETSHFPTDQVDLLLHGVLDLNEVPRWLTRFCESLGGEGCFFEGECGKSWVGQIGGFIKVHYNPNPCLDGWISWDFWSFFTRKLRNLFQVSWIHQLVFCLITGT